MSQDKSSTGSKFDVAQLWQRVPEPLRIKAAKLKTRFLAAKKSTQYAIAGSAAVLVLLVFSMGENSGDLTSGSITFQARRGNLDITVLEGGSLEALQSQEIRSRVKGREGVKILNIVEEGYRVTPEDVTAGKILVELDKSQLIDEQLNQEIAVETAEASYIERKAEYEIQLNQNMTDLNDARQEVRFAKLDFEKYLGGNIVNEIVEQLEIEERLALAEQADLEAAQLAGEPALDVAAVTDSAAGSAELPFDLDAMPPQMQERIRQAIADNGGTLPAEMLQRMQSFGQGGPPRGSRGSRGRPDSALTDTAVESGAREPREPETLSLSLQAAVSSTTSTRTLDAEPNLLMDDSYMAIRDRLDFTQYADINKLEDGEAKQQLRSLQDGLQVAQEELLLAQDRIAGQRRLEARGFITPTELEAEELNLNKARNKMEQEETSLKLYIQYTFPKEAEEKLSDYENAVMSYQRQVKENIAEKAQEAARYSSAERKYNLERVKLADVNEQIELATIRAQRPGLVVYGASDQNSMRYRSNSQEAIQEGATVRERQSILTIPDMREMAVKVNIHESAVQRVAVGQTVKVSVDAFPDEELTGVVTKVAVVADSANSFMNPDLKVYPTTIKIDGTHEWLRPGMSAEIEILVRSLEDVVYIPIQAVTYFDEKRVVYVSNRGRPERREIEVGTFSDSFIEVTSGLAEGEEVLLLPPQQSLNDSSGG
ncbi:MAG: HlyD family efflux transporter periplasmic adaptor subunit [Gammaproteobacteria bacterium]|jgi:multidrug resistance efflux pump|nr:HlyD family efflux transporter periplasmic adaptor subunit [Pseudomonadales bacterium]MBT7225090.1 HlyD family efflux transporter periplasmic adaptor subunit [Gammaproteobacteria bacterium]